VRTWRGSITIVLRSKHVSEPRDTDDRPPRRNVGNWSRYLWSDSFSTSLQRIWLPAMHGLDGCHQNRSTLLCLLHLPRHKIWRGLPKHTKFLRMRLETHLRASQVILSDLWIPTLVSLLPCQGHSTRHYPKPARFLFLR
jgi:hypothetical protein